MIKVNEDGLVEIIQGDTGEINISDFYIPDGSTDVTLYMSIYDDNDNILSETYPYSITDNNVKIILPASFTDRLQVEKGEEYTEYYYAFKLCYTDKSGLQREDTLMFDDSITVEHVIRIYPKRVKGLGE